MQDFNEYSNNKNDAEGNDIFGIVNRLAKQYDGKSQTELLKAIHEKAKEGKKNGTLTNAQIDAFAGMLAPVLDEKQKKVLYKVITDLKKI